MLEEKYKHLAAILIICTLWGCNERGNENLESYNPVNLDDVQGYWESNGVGFPANIDGNFRIIETGLPAPTGMRNELQYYYNIVGNNIDCYVKCIVDAYYPDATDMPVYTIHVDNDYSINIENVNTGNINLFEGDMTYYITLDNNNSSIIFLREGQNTNGFTHTYFTLNKINKDEWDSLVREAITPNDSCYEIVYQQIFN